MIRYANVKTTIVLNRILLIVLARVMKMYRRQSGKLISTLDGDTLWVSGVLDEEKHLDRTEKIIDRRMHSACKSKSKK